MTRRLLCDCDDDSSELEDSNEVSRNHVNVKRVKKMGEIKSVFDYTISNGQENEVIKVVNFNVSKLSPHTKEISTTVIQCRWL